MDFFRGRPGHRTMEVNGRSTVSYLVRTLHVPFFLLLSIGLEAGFQLSRGDMGSLPLYGGTFARSYAVSIFCGMPRLKALGCAPACLLQTFVGFFSFAFFSQVLQETMPEVYPVPWMGRLSLAHSLSWVTAQTRQKYRGLVEIGDG